MGVNSTCISWGYYWYCSFLEPYQLFLSPRSHLGARSMWDRSGLYTSWMWTFSLFWDRSGIDPTWIASGAGQRSVPDRSTLFRAEWERKHVLKAIQLGSVPSWSVTQANLTWGLLFFQDVCKKRRTMDRGGNASSHRCLGWPPNSRQSRQKSPERWCLYGNGHQL